jgi:hypothetical protein
MACTIGSGRTEPCKDVVGGLKAVYILNFETDNYSVGENSTDTAANMRVPRLSSIGTDSSNEALAYRYELKGNSSYTENVQASRENGTLAFEQVLELQLKKLTKQSHKEIKALSFGRPHIIVEDYNGNLFLAGREHGMEVTGGTIVTGTAMSDMSGYTLTLTGMERKPAQFLTAATDVADTLSDAFVDVDGDVDGEFGDTDLP